MKAKRGLDRRRACAQVLYRRRRCRGRPSAPHRRRAGRAERRRRRGIGDAHLTDREQVAVRRHGSISDVDGGKKFVGVHRRRDGEIAGRPFQFDRHHAQFGAAEAGDLVDGRAAAGEIRHHLRGDRLRIGGDAARRDAVIAGKNRDRDLLEPWHFAPLPARQPYRKLFETAETSRRFGQRLLPKGGGRSGVPVAGGQVATERADFV